MTYKYFFLFALLLAAPTYYDGQNITAGTLEYSTVVSANAQSIALSNEYFSAIVREGACAIIDAYRFCVQNISYNPVEHYPHEVRIEMDIDNICGDACVAFGLSCTRNNECASNYCVHGICRSTPTFCGDDVCDENEACIIDCGEPEPQPTVIAEAPPLEPVLVTPPQQTEPVSQTLAGPETDSDSAPQPSPQPVSEVSSNKPNWVAGLIILLIGIVSIVIIFKNHRHATI